MASSTSENSVSEVEIQDAVERTGRDLLEALKATGHFTCRYSNGLLSAVRLEAIPGSRGVHVEVVHVLDLRAAQFGKSGLAMRAALLESVSRDYEAVLHDVGLGDCIERKCLRTPFRNVSLLVLRGMTGKGVSLVHPTRTVYVVTKNVRPTIDLSWLTDSGRVVTAEEFALLRRSDARSLLPELKHSVKPEKWTHLEKSIRRGWLGVLGMSASVVGIITAAIILLATSGSLIPSILTIFTSSLIGLWLLSSSKESLTMFEQTLSNEASALGLLGDTSRIKRSIQDNEGNLRLLGDISFVVSPLMAAMAKSIEAGNTHEPINLACSILDECVRLAPAVQSKNRDQPKSADEGLARFLGLFDCLGVELEKEELALSYVALTGHITSPLSFEDMLHHVGVLNNTLYNAGALRPAIKEEIDDKINDRAMKRFVDEIDESLDTDGNSVEEDVRIETQVNEESPVESNNQSVTEEIDEDFLDDMKNSSIDMSSKSGLSVPSEDIPVIVAETVTEAEIEDTPPTAVDIVASQGRTTETVKVVQTYLFDSEEGESTGS